MNPPRWNGKRRRSASGSDSFSGSCGDSSDSSLLPSGPVLSPPPGLGRCLKDLGRQPAAAAGTPEHSRGGGCGGQLCPAVCREVYVVTAQLACLHGLLGFYSLSQFVTCDWYGRSRSVRAWTCILGNSLVIIFKWFVGHSTFTETTSQVASLIICGRLNAPLYRSLCWKCFISGYALYCLSPTHRNSKTRWRTNH